MAVVMVTQGRFVGSFPAVVGRVTENPNEPVPADAVLLCRDGLLPECDLSSFAAVMVEGGGVNAPRVGTYDSLAHLAPDDLVMIDGRSGRTRTLYRKASPHNALFVTEQCNSNCIMCSQPPKPDRDDLLGMCLRMIDLLKSAPPARLGVTGGEPTLLGDGFLRLIDMLRSHLPDTDVTVLTNGRSFSNAAFARSVAQIGHPHLRFSVPLHADIAAIHDHITQATGAFNQTVAGLYNMAATGMEAEVRVVLHAINVPRLVPLAEFIYRKLTFLQNVAFMGLENMGQAKRNWGSLWIDPVDYAASLKDAVEHLFRRGMNPLIYNLPLCVLPPSAWAFACQSISDHKQILVDECADCGVASHCPGFFASGRERRSRGVRPIALTAEIPPIWNDLAVT